MRTAAYDGADCEQSSSMQSKHLYREVGSSRTYLGMVTHYSDGYIYISYRSALPVPEDCRVEVKL